MSATQTSMNKTASRFAENIGKHSFVPKTYGFSNQAEILAYVVDNPFAQLVSNQHDGLLATSIPLILETDNRTENNEEGIIFVGHIAKRNPYREAIETGSPALASFVGPNAYVSPRWFKINKTVPTWNFVCVHIHGRLEAINNPKDTLAVMEKTVAQMEASIPLHSDEQPWTMQQSAKELVDSLFNEILAFRFVVDSIEGIQRLNQEKHKLDQLSISQGLARSLNKDSQDIAQIMMRNFA